LISRGDRVQVFFVQQSSSSDLSLGLAADNRAKQFLLLLVRKTKLGLDPTEAPVGVSHFPHEKKKNAPCQHAQGCCHLSQFAANPAKKKKKKKKKTGRRVFGGKKKKKKCDIQKSAPGPQKRCTTPRFRGPYFSNGGKKKEDSFCQLVVGWGCRGGVMGAGLACASRVDFLTSFNKLWHVIFNVLDTSLNPKHTPNTPLYHFLYLPTNQ